MRGVNAMVEGGNPVGGVDPVGRIELLRQVEPFPVGGFDSGHQLKLNIFQSNNDSPKNIVQMRFMIVY